MPNQAGCPQRTSCVAGSRRNENILQAKLAFESADQKCILKNASSEADLHLAGFLLKGHEQVDDQLRDGSLRTTGKISFLLCPELRLRGGKPEFIEQNLGRHEAPGRIATKIAQIEVGENLTRRAQYAEENIFVYRFGS